MTATLAKDLGATPPSTAASAPSGAAGVGRRGTPRRRPPRAPRGEPSAVRRTVIVCTSTVALLGILVLGFGGYLLLLSPIQQGRTQQNLYDVLAGDLELAVAPVDGVIEPGTPVALLEIPSLGVRQVVLEGTTSGVLMNGPGHRRDTALPGQAGVSVLLGRSGLFGAPFADLTRLRAGDVIVVTTGQARSTFAVSGVRRSTDPVPPASAAPATLTLSTAHPPLQPTESLLLTADLTSAVQPGRPDATSITAAERSLAGDPSAALPLMLWCQVLLLAVTATTWGFLRWERWPTYVIAAPVLLAVLWNVYENVVQLLPNTM